MSSKVVVGKFGAAHGVRGEIKVYSYTDPIENIVEYLPWQIKLNRNTEWQTIEVEGLRWHGDVLLAKIHGIDDRDVVRAYTNLEIAIDRDQLPETDEDEYYWSDLIGLTVYDQNGTELGKVDSHFDAGSNDMMVVKGEDEFYIPYTADTVTKVELDEKRIFVNWEPL